MKRTHFLGTALLFFGLMASAQTAFADHTVIQGVEQDGRGWNLPVTLCAYPGGEIRLGAMVMRGNQGYVPPAEEIMWSVIQENGHRIDWSPAYSSYQPPFQRDMHFNRAIRLHLPSYRGFRLQLIGGARGTRQMQMNVVDANGPGGARCQWGPRGMYTQR